MKYNYNCYNAVPSNDDNGQEDSVTARGLTQTIIIIIVIVIVICCTAIIVPVVIIVVLALVHRRHNQWIIKKLKSKDLPDSVAGKLKACGPEADDTDP